jgi:hypothetical protein
MSTMGQPNCTSYPPLQPNPDISGLGVYVTRTIWNFDTPMTWLTLCPVLIGFLVPPILTLLLCIVQFLINQECSTRIDKAAKLKARQALRMITGLFGREIKLSAKSSNKWISAIEGSILAASDQQVVIGISILISGFTQLKSGISSYHWQSVVNLAWLSSVTHLITLTSLRRQTRDNSPFRWWRITAMGIMAGMLIVAIHPVGYLTSSSGIPYSFPAWCLYQPNLTWYNSDSGHELLSTYNNFYMALVLSILLSTYIQRVFTLFPSKGRPLAIVLHLCVPFEAVLSKLEDSEPRNMLLKMGAWAIYSVIRSAYTVLISGYHVFGSSLWEVFNFESGGFEHCNANAEKFTWLGFTLAWGAIRVFRSRQGYSNSEMYHHPILGDDTLLRVVLTQEGVWGFGQVISVILLALPFVAFYGKA